MNIATTALHLFESFTVAVRIGICHDRSQTKKRNESNLGRTSALMVWSGAERDPHPCWAQYCADVPDVGTILSPTWVDAFHLLLHYLSGSNRWMITCRVRWPCAQVTYVKQSSFISDRVKSGTPINPENRWNARIYIYKNTEDRADNIFKNVSM